MVWLQWDSGKICFTNLVFYKYNIGVNLTNLVFVKYKIGPNLCIEKTKSIFQINFNQKKFSKITLKYALFKKRAVN